MKPLVLTLACVVAGTAIFTVPLKAAADTELKDDAGKTIIRYVVEPPAGVAPAGTTDPARQVGLFLCFPEHDTPVDADIFPGPAGPLADGNSRQLRAARRRSASPEIRHGRYGADREADRVGEEDVSDQSAARLHVRQRRGRQDFGGVHDDASQHRDRRHRSQLGLLGDAVRVERADRSVEQRAGDLHESGTPRSGHPPHRPFGTLIRASRRKATTSSIASSRTWAPRSYYPPSNDDSIAWATRLRNKNIEPSAEERRLLKAYGSGSAAAVTDGYFPALALVGGAPAGDVLQKLFQSKDANIRAAAAETGSHGFFGERTVAAMAQLIADPSPTVRQAAIRALGMNANWRSQAAQQALIQLATNKSADLNDRLNATDAIGYAVRLQVRGVRQDPPMFQALVSLLADKEEPVRASANAILAPVYQPASATPPLKAPAGGWQNWLDEITTKEAGYLKDYEVCGWGNRDSRKPSSRQPRIFGAGGSVLHGRQRAAWAEPGNRPAGEAGSAGGIPIHASGRREGLCPRRRPH